MHIRNQMVRQLGRRNVSFQRETSFVRLPHATGKMRVLRMGPLSASATERPPLVLLGGTAQTVATWTPFTQHLGRERELIILELRGQGQTTLDPLAANVQQQVQDVEAVLREMGDLPAAVEEESMQKRARGPVDLLGFSFGGRVAVAVARHLGNAHVRKLVLTSVPTERDTLAEIILESWERLLANGLMAEFAWSAIINGHSAAYLESNRDRLRLWADMVVSANQAERVLGILQHSHEPADAPWAVASCARNVRSPTLTFGGVEDRIAPIVSTRAVAAIIEATSGVDAQHVDLRGGHLCHFEDPTKWLRRTLQFLDTK